ncbi:hypothetical protein Bca101_015124 [Brassica carinata]
MIPVVIISELLVEYTASLAKLIAVILPRRQGDGNFVRIGNFSVYCPPRSSPVPDYSSHLRIFKSHRSIMISVVIIVELLVEYTTSLAKLTAGILPRRQGDGNFVRIGNFSVYCPPRSGVCVCGNIFLSTLVRFIDAGTCVCVCVRTQRRASDAEKISVCDEKPASKLSGSLTQRLSLLHRRILRSVLELSPSLSISNPLTISLDLEPSLHLARALSPSLSHSSPLSLDLRRELSLFSDASSLTKPISSSISFRLSQAVSISSSLHLLPSFIDQTHLSRLDQTHPFHISRALSPSLSLVHVIAYCSLKLLTLSSLQTIAVLEVSHLRPFQALTLIWSHTLNYVSGSQAQALSKLSLSANSSHSIFGCVCVSQALTLIWSHS